MARAVRGSAGNVQAAGTLADAKRADEDLTPRGVRTKAALLDAARVVFERDGFINARITDIAEQANVAHGTFYTYFSDKEDVFKAVAAQLPGEFIGANATGGAQRPEGETPYEAILRANRHYYETYLGRGRVLGVVEQVATFSEEFRALRRQLRLQFVARNERAIRRWQAEGICDPHLDAHCAASALGSMVDRSIYIWLVLDEPHDPEVAIETLSRLWANALGLAVPDHAPKRKGRSSASSSSAKAAGAARRADGSKHSTAPSGNGSRATKPRTAAR